MRFFLSSICLTALLTLSAQAQEVVDLWPANAIPNAIPSAKITEKSVTEGGILRISNVSVPTLTTYLPPVGTATGAAVMVCPGGGYSILASSHEGEDIAQWLNGMGVTAFVLKYRLPNPDIMTTQYEVPLIDAMQGIALIRQNAAKYKIDPAKIGVMGFSAGGHLASTLSTHYFRGKHASETARPSFSILVYPVITFGRAAHVGSREKLLGSQKASPELIAYYSNELQVTDQTPPTFLVHAEDDKAVPVENSIIYYQACTAKNVPVEMHLYPKGGHGFGLRTAKYGTLNEWPDACKAWLKSLGMLEVK